MNGYPCTNEQTNFDEAFHNHNPALERVANVFYINIVESII